MPFTPGRPLPDEEAAAQDGALYLAVRPDLRLVTFERRAGQWYWRVLSDERPHGPGTWADVQRILTAPTVEDQP
ncbi:hypothetical protein [Deinococcus sedimenti]|uniref:Uncharacterized protein n=1 Tax=Deinococcus sedimenti TaxID=1867090 RepID=A0ABQ2SDL6_9DEIO|nr:hypothetical protein [Deinococcus sedimenti]GGS11519.1 hypothetical protein GCM10008960_41810 [Deinococcus sedimenti]